MVFETMTLFTSIHISRNYLASFISFFTLYNYLQLYITIHCDSLDLKDFSLVNKANVLFAALKDNAKTTHCIENCFLCIEYYTSS